MQEFFAQYFGAILILIGIAIALTIYVFRRRKFERGYRKGEAADPERVRRENPS
jgi:hypothetical protein